VGEIETKIWSCVFETQLLSENRRSVPREWFDIFTRSREQWSNDKIIIELGHRNISWFARVSQINYLLRLRQIIDLLLTEQSRYFAQSGSIINYPYLPFTLIWLFLSRFPLVTLAKGPFLESPENFNSRARKAIRKTQTRLFCEAGLFIGCKGNKN